MLISIYSVFYLVLSIKRLDWAVMLMLALLPTYQIRFDIAGIPFTMLEVMILIAFAVWLIKNYQKIIVNFKNKIKTFRDPRSAIREIRYPFANEIIAMLIISWIAIIVAGGSNAALGVWKAYFFEPVLVFILVMNVFKDNANLRISMRTYEHANTDSKSGSTAPEAVEPLGSIEKILWPLTISALFVSLAAIFQRVTGLFIAENFWPRVTGPFPYPNALGLYLGPLVMVMIGWGIYKSRIADRGSRIADKTDNYQSYIIYTTIIFSVTAIILARSEGALAGMLVALLFFAGFAVSGKIIKSAKIYKIGLVKFFIIIAIFLAYPLIVLNVYPRYWYPHTGVPAADYVISKIMLKDLSGEIRRQQWRETWAMLKTNYIWLVGTGLSGYREKILPFHQPGIFFNFEGDPDFRRKIVWFDEKYKAEHWQPVEIYMYPHSLVLNFWTELGLVGAVLFVWIIIKFLYIGIRNWKLEIGNSPGDKASFFYLGLVGAMTVIIVHGIVDVPYFKNDLAVIFWVLIALMGLLGIYTRKKENNIPKQE